MEVWGRAPTRTEADIRAALAELGAGAPSTDDVLSALRETGSRRQRGSPRRPSQPRPVGPGRVPIPGPGWPQLAVGAARQIARGQWRIAGHTRLRGQRAIKLAQTRSGTFQGHPVFLWISTATYLPVRMISVTAKFTEADNWYYLPPSKVNLAHLRVPIPPG